ncbi:MAG: GntR family transcriptional regulator [Eubacterium sp.]|nr:GntR family transcriptional regulator [Eubacterium sp.]
MEETKFQQNNFLPLREVVFHTLRDQILRGELEPGERLMEVHLAEKLGVSRTPVREAIRKLEDEGLAVVNPRRGAEVAKMSEKDMDDVLQIRLSLDALAVRMACDHMTDENQKKIHQAMVGFERAVAKGNLKEIAEADEKFHDEIYNSTNNSKLIVIITTIREQMFRYRFEYIKDASNYPRLVEEHRLIYKGLVERDHDMVEEAIQVHIAGQRKGVVVRIRNS